MKTKLTINLKLASIVTKLPTKYLELDQPTKTWYCILIQTGGRWNELRSWEEGGYFDSLVQLQKHMITEYKLDSRDFLNLLNEYNQKGQAA